MNYKKQNFKIKTWLPHKLVKQAVEEGWINTLVYFVQLRKIHSKPLFYNYSLRKLSEPLKCSPTTLSYHLKIMAQKGLIKVTDSNLLLIGSYKLRIQYKSTLTPIKYSLNRKDQLNLIRYSLINNNLYQQNKAIQEKKNVISIHKAPKLRLLKKIIRKHGSLSNVETSLNEKLILSNMTVGVICNRSQSTGLKIQKALNKLKVVKTKRNVKLCSTERYNRRAFYNLCLPSKYLLSKDGYVFLSQPNEWVVR